MARSHLKTTSGLLWLVEQFAAPKTVAEVLADATKRETGSLDSLEAAFQKAIAELTTLGILVEHVQPSREELGAWLTADVRPGDNLQDVSEDGQIHTLEISSSRLGKTLLSRPREPSEPEGHHRELVGNGTPWWGCRRPDGRIVLLGDAGSVRRAWETGSAASALILRPEDWLALAAEAPDDFFGTQRGGIPYQSIAHEKKVLVPGRRPEMDLRMSFLRPDDLAGKRVLDLGCNIGMSCRSALEMGATSAVGLDLSTHLIRAASALNCYFASPARFFVHDLEKPFGRGLEADTAFCFAVVGHLRRTSGLLETLRSSKVKVLYVETHCELQTQGDIEALWGSGIVREKELLGKTRDNIARSQSTRHLYRCELC